MFDGLCINWCILLLNEARNNSQKNLKKKSPSFSSHSKSNDYSLSPSPKKDESFQKSTAEREPEIKKWVVENNLKRKEQKRNGSKEAKRNSGRKSSSSSFSRSRSKGKKSPAHSNGSRSPVELLYMFQMRIEGDLSGAEKRKIENERVVTTK